MEEVKLGTLTNRKIGYGIVQPGNSVPNGIPVIKVNNVVSGLKDINNLDTTTAEIDSKYLRTKLVGGEIIVSVVGTVGKTAIVPKSFAGCNIVRATAMVDILDPTIKYWVKYYLDSPQGQQYIKMNLNTTVQYALNIKSLVEMPIPMYNSKYMEKAISILKSLDDKIEVNRRINENLEQQAQALFKSWFVDFEPFKDGEFVESELGMIPNGWRVGNLNEIADITMGTSPSGTSYNTEGKGDVFYQGRAEFKFRFPQRNMFTTEAKRFADVDSVLVSVRAPVGDINVAEERCCIGRGLASVKSINKCNSFILYLLQSLKPIFNSFNGEGTVFGCINKKAFEEIRIVIPLQNSISAFESIASSIDRQIKRNEQESRRLASLRDTLLPRLMSGEIRVDEINVL
ncbi:MAG: restriction endonuclease subunit S [Prevotella sp.]|nr:restriction endonuclease subunit S [Prevotella sp.]